MARVRLRFHGELNDFLAPDQRHQAVQATQTGGAPLRHLVESVGVPHTEVARATHGGCPIGLDACPPDDSLLELYPWSAEHPQHPPDGGMPSFIADAHLGQLARRLRLLGFDTRFDNDLGDDRLIAQSVAEGRVLLSVRGYRTSALPGLSSR